MHMATPVRKGQGGQDPVSAVYSETVAFMKVAGISTGSVTHREQRGGEKQGSRGNKDDSAFTIN